MLPITSSTLSITSAMLSKSVLFDYEPVMAYQLSMKHLPRVPSFIEPFDVADNAVAADPHLNRILSLCYLFIDSPLSILTTLTKSVVTLITLEKYGGLGPDNRAISKGPVRGALRIALCVPNGNGINPIHGKRAQASAGAHHSKPAALKAT